MDDEVVETLIAAGMDAIPPPWHRELARSEVEMVVRTIAPLIRSDALGRPTTAQLSWHVDQLAELQQRFAAVCATAGEQDARLRALEREVRAIVEASQLPEAETAILADLLAARR